MNEEREPDKKVSTKQRIIDTALALFNERGYGRVTTALLASEVGIAEGNLWYHFRDKTALLVVLDNALEKSIRARLKIRPTGGPVLPEYLQYFYMMSKEFYDYRFLFRDQVEYGAHDMDWIARVPELYRASKGQYLEFFEMLREQGYLEMSDVELEHVVVGLLLIFRYYMEFAGEANLGEHSGFDAARRAFAIHMRLFEDRLTEDAKQFFRSELELDQLPVQIM